MWLATSTYGWAKILRAIGSSSAVSFGYMPELPTSPSITDMVIGRRYLSKISRNSTSPEKPPPGISALEAKPSPSIWMVSRRRPLSVVESGTGICGRRSASRRNWSGWMIQRSWSVAAFWRTA
ncbi:hypothetical protein D3C85_1559190 [compost metagenome]